ncbi:DUF2207 domain-containing protein [Patescibacteria group bacterium]|nr:DUF2207 domain-containing protein [Patescibacteria group bacterium]MBU1448860.1 DUF2207 domain-containing protein [Patescibacteria group bacterium]MBU2613648.1 DUF2207 domain-containing protein [Patescibacteria group bacterium]
MNPKRLLFTVVALAAVLLPSTAFAEEAIRDFSVDATVDSERLLRVTETITYDFGDEERHGIYRYIPTQFVRNGVDYDYRIKVVDVTMDGEPATYVSSGGSGQVCVKIGDADVTITGPHTYAITYETDRAVTFFDDHTELYWNVTGNEWAIPIEASDFTLTLPADIAPSDIRTACFIGLYGSTEASCDTAVSGRDVMFVSTRELDTAEGLAVVIGIPNGIILPPTTMERLLMFLADNYAAFVPILALIVMWLLWKRKGRDPKLGTVIPLYEAPRGLLPAEIACARRDGCVPSRAVTATIIDLARRGYLHIRYEGKKNYTFVKTASKETSEPSAAERAILKGLFEKGDEVKVGDLQENNFYQDVANARAAVEMRIKDLGVFDKNPGLVRIKYIAFGCITGFVLMFVFAAAALGWLAAILSSVIIIMFGWFMPRRTEDGVKLLAEIKGFEWFMTVTEKDRLTFHNAPAKTPEKFMELLPYAIALGIETEWAKLFEGIDLPQPEWAEGQGWSHLGAVAFASSLHTLDSKASSSGYSPPSSAGSGGSGFSGGGSGGGGGGGGGGSW